MKVIEIEYKGIKGYIISINDYHGYYFTFKGEEYGSYAIGKDMKVHQKVMTEAFKGVVDNLL